MCTILIRFINHAIEYKVGNQCIHFQKRMVNECGAKIFIDWNIFYLRDMQSM